MPSSPVTGWFDPSPKGGFLRQAAKSYLPGKGDPQVRLPGLRRGDLLVLENGRVASVNGLPAEQLDGRPEFASLGAVHPSRPLVLETPRASSQRTADIQRAVDLICPFGFGQRALIVSPPKAGKTMMLQAIAEAVAENHPQASLLILLVDERPEEVTEMIDWGRGEVVASSFDLPHERHVAAAEMVFDHARRQVELGRDVVIVLDSLTRLARSHNTTGRGSGRTMSGGLDANALAKPKSMVGAARAVPQGGSLSVIAPARPPRRAPAGARRDRKPHGRRDLRGVQGHGQRRAAARARAGGPPDLSRHRYRRQRHASRRAARRRENDRGETKTPAGIGGPPAGASDAEPPAADETR